MPHLDSGFSHSKAINRPLCVCACSKRVLACWARICACTHVGSDMDRSRANHTINHRAGPAWHFLSPHTSTVIPFNVHCNRNTHAHTQTYSGLVPERVLSSVLTWPVTMHNVENNPKIAIKKIYQSNNRGTDFEISLSSVQFYIHCQKTPPMMNFAWAQQQSQFHCFIFSCVK